MAPTQGSMAQSRNTLPTPTGQLRFGAGSTCRCGRPRPGRLTPEPHAQPAGDARPCGEPKEGRRHVWQTSGPAKPRHSGRPTRGRCEGSGQRAPCGPHPETRPDHLLGHSAPAKRTWTSPSPPFPSTATSPGRHGKAHPRPTHAASCAGVPFSSLVWTPLARPAGAQRGPPAQNVCGPTRGSGPASAESQPSRRGTGQRSAPTVGLGCELGDPGKVWGHAAAGMSFWVPRPPSPSRPPPEQKAWGGR